VRRHISLVTRKTVNQVANFRRLREELVTETARYFSTATGAAHARDGRHR